MTDNQTQNIVILGSTGSIGINTLDIIRRFPQRFKVVGLAAHSNCDLLEKQARAFRPTVVALFDKKRRALLTKKLAPIGIEVLGGAEGIIEVAQLSSADKVVSAIVGAAGLLPTLTAVKAGKTVALANKEALVMAGEIIMREAKRHQASILPIDSEHSALFQLLWQRQPQEIRKLILTGSGGPLLRMTEQQKKHISCEEALKHPTWKMGPKISIDSATLMNKGFEIIEARWLFNLPEKKIDVVIHPQSIIHSMVEFSDRSIMAQMGLPDMRVPIAYTLFYPQRGALPFKSLDLTKVGSLTFEQPNTKSFPLLGIARDTLKSGGTMPAVLNVANDGAVSAFLAKRIPFSGICKTICRVLSAHQSRPVKTIEDILLADRWAQLETERMIQKQSQ